MTKLTNLTNWKPNFVNFVKLVMQNYKSDGIRRNIEKKRMALLAHLTQFARKCAKSVKSAKQIFT